MAIQPDMIGLVVQDIAMSIRFYRLLGLDIPDVKAGEDYAEVIAPNGYRISWNTVKMTRDIDSGYVEPVGYRMELAFKCDSPAEVDSTYAALTEQGYSGYKEPWDAFWGQRYAVVIDPDGNHVSVFASL